MHYKKEKRATALPTGGITNRLAVEGAQWSMAFKEMEQFQKPSGFKGLVLGSKLILFLFLCGHLHANLYHHHLQTFLHLSVFIYEHQYSLPVKYEMGSSLYITEGILVVRKHLWKLQDLIALSSNGSGNSLLGILQVYLKNCTCSWVSFHPALFFNSSWFYQLYLDNQ